MPRAKAASWFCKDCLGQAKAPVAKLKEKLPKAQTWSNGNVFRSLTLLAVTWAEKEGKTLEEALTPEKLKEFCGMLEFNKFGDSTIFDVKIE